MSNLAAEPGVPFPMDAKAGPEVPFPLKIVEEVMCRDCPFPADVTPDMLEILKKWQDDALQLIKTRFQAAVGPVEPKPYPELIGKTLEVVKPGGGARFIDNPNRIVITIDEAAHIKHILIGHNIHPAGVA